MDEIYLISTSANYIHDDGGQYVKKPKKTANPVLKILHSEFSTNWLKICMVIITPQADVSLL